MADSSNDLTKINNATVQFWLDLVSNTETPPIMHAWALISATAACMTRRRWANVGALRYFPNMYVMLTGPAGVRKSTAITFARRLLSDIPAIRFGPNNTAGRMQGLITAMMPPETKQLSDEERAVDEALGAITGAANLFESDKEPVETHKLNRAALWCAEGEAVTFLGRQADEFVTFLGDMWDMPERFAYQTRRERLEVHFPCLNLIGGITPMHITTYLPPTAIGQGFSSRVIFVYAGADETKPIAWPEPFDEGKMAEMKSVMAAIFNSEVGEFFISPEAKRAIIDLYAYKPAIDDVRFLHYAQRRQAHLVKAAMAMCALRLDDTISAQDVYDAHRLLVITEVRMPDAIGTHGLDPAALAKARVMDYLRARQEPVTLVRVLLAAGSDVKKADVQRAVLDLIDVGSIVQVELRDASGQRRPGYVWAREANAFRAGQAIEVDYSLNATEEAEHSKTKAGSRESATKRAAEIMTEEAAPTAKALQLANKMAPAPAVPAVSDSADDPPADQRSFRELMAATISATRH